MSLVLLNLVVIRAVNIDRAVQFYEQLGLQFAKQQHGNGPEHYSTNLGTTVFEIYPYKNGAQTTEGVRLGFIVESLLDLMDRLKALDIKIISPPRSNESGWFAVVEDFDGHRVELSENHL